MSLLITITHTFFLKGEKHNTCHFVLSNKGCRQRKLIINVIIHKCFTEHMIYLTIPTIYFFLCYFCERNQIISLTFKGILQYFYSLLHLLSDISCGYEMAF